MKHNGQRPRHQALQVLKTPGENTVIKKAARQEMEETRKKKKRSEQSSQINKNKKRVVNRGHDAHKINSTLLFYKKSRLRVPVAKNGKSQKDGTKLLYGLVATWEELLAALHSECMLRIYDLAVAL